MSVPTYSMEGLGQRGVDISGGIAGGIPVAEDTGGPGRVAGSHETRRTGRQVHGLETSIPMGEVGGIFRLPGEAGAAA